MERTKVWRAVFVTACMLLVVGGSGLILSQYPPSRNFFEHYFDEQIWGHLRITPEVDAEKFPYTRVSPAKFLYYLFIQLWQPLLVVAVGLAAAFIKSGKKQASWFVAAELRVSVFWLCIALGASFPMMISRKFSDFYLIPSEAFFALSFGLLLASPLFYLLNALPSKLLKAINAMGVLAHLVLIGVCIYLAGNPIRSVDELSNADAITSAAYGQHINASPEIQAEHTLCSILNRHAKVKITDKEAKFWIGFDWQPPPAGFIKVELPLKKIILAKKEESK